MTVTRYSSDAGALIKSSSSVMSNNTPVSTMVRATAAMATAAVAKTTATITKTSRQHGRQAPVDVTRFEYWDLAGGAS